MLVGILSDTHGNAAMTAAAVDVLGGRGAEYFIHCGDVGSQRVLDALAGLPAAVVLGNVDDLDIEGYAHHLGLRCAGRSDDLTLDDKRIAVLHGDDAALKRSLLAGQEHDYLLQGHTHVAQDVRIGRTRIINPGALHRAQRKTVALLNTARDRVEFLDVIDS